MDEHLKKHTRLGQVENGVDYVPRQVEAILEHGELPLNSLIILYNSHRDPTKEAQSREQLEGVHGETEFEA